MKTKNTRSLDPRDDVKTLPDLMLRCYTMEGTEQHKLESILHKFLLAVAISYKPPSCSIAITDIGRCGYTWLTMLIPSAPSIQESYEQENISRKIADALMNTGLVEWSDIVEKGYDVYGLLYHLVYRCGVSLEDFIDMLGYLAENGFYLVLRGEKKDKADRNNEENALI